MHISNTNPNEIPETISPILLNYMPSPSTSFYIITFDPKLIPV